MMSRLVIYSALFLIITVICSAELNNCTLLSELEFALYNTDSNEGQLNRAFFPPRKATSRYINVTYDFLNETGGSDGCNVTYVWAIGGFLLIQPPGIFQFLSLFFSYPANDVNNITLTLPYECRRLINTTSTREKCSCSSTTSNNLDILTQQIMQYSKFNNNSEVVRDEKSTAQSLCYSELESPIYRNASVTPYFSASVILPVAIAFPSVAIILRYYKEIELQIDSPIDRPSIIGAVFAGIFITIYIFVMDMFAMIRYGITHKYEYRYLDKKPYLVTWQYVPCLVELLVSVLAFLILLFFPMCLYPRWKRVTTFLYTSFMIIPIVFVSAHIDFIFAAWLTEPSKTTSIAIMALAIILFLFLINKTVYIFIRNTYYIIRLLISRRSNRYGCYNINNFTKEFCSMQTLWEVFILVITFILSSLGAALLSLHIAGFYVLPIPSLNLADYLENIVQISLVILASLITYRIISVHESDTSKILKNLRDTNQHLVRIISVYESAASTFQSSNRPQNATPAIACRTQTGTTLSQSASPTITCGIQVGTRPRIVSLTIDSGTQTDTRPRSAPLTIVCGTQTGTTSLQSASPTIAYENQVDTRPRISIRPRIAPLTIDHGTQTDTMPRNASLTIACGTQADTRPRSASPTFASPTYTCRTKGTFQQQKLLSFCYFRKTALVELPEAVLCAQVPRQHVKNILIVTNKMTLIIPPFPKDQKEVHTFLNEAMLKVQLGAGDDTTINISLRDAILEVDNVAYSTTQVEIRLKDLHLYRRGEKKYASLAIYDSIDSIKKVFSLNLPCSIIKSSLTNNYYGGSWIRYDNSVEIKYAGNTEHYVLTDSNTFDGTVDVTPAIKIGSKKISLEQPVKLNGHNVDISLELFQGTITLQYRDKETVTLIVGEETIIDVPLNKSIEIKSKNRQGNQPKVIPCKLMKANSNDQANVITFTSDRIIIIKTSSDDSSLTLHLAQNEIFLTQDKIILTQDKNLKIEMENFEGLFLHAINEFKIIESSKTKADFKVKVDLYEFGPCNDSSLLYFPQ